MHSFSLIYQHLHLKKNTDISRSFDYQIDLSSLFQRFSVCSLYADYAI